MTDIGSSAARIAVMRDNVRHRAMMSLMQNNMICGLRVSKVLLSFP